MQQPKINVIALNFKDSNTYFVLGNGEGKVTDLELGRGKSCRLWLIRTVYAHLPTQAELKPSNKF